MARTAPWRARRRQRSRQGEASAGSRARRVDKDELLGFYRQMLLIRRFEERAGQLYGMGLIGGFCHLYIGQEAIAVGMQAVKQPGDQVITGYRDHGHMLAAGVDPKAVMAELTGRAAGASKGKGGSMHMFCARARLLRRPRHRRRLGQPRHRPGARQPLPRQQGGGLRLFRRRRGQPGPGLRELQHGRALEAAGRLRDREQPVRHGHQRSSASSSETHLYRRGASFNIPGEEVDGMDVLAVREAGAEGRRARPLRQGPVHPGDEDLPLPRPLDERSGQVPHPRGDRRGAQAPATRSTTCRSGWRRQGSPTRRR